MVLSSESSVSRASMAAAVSRYPKRTLCPTGTVMLADGRVLLEILPAELVEHLAEAGEGRFFGRVVFGEFEIRMFGVFRDVRGALFVDNFDALVVVGLFS